MMSWMGFVRVRSISGRSPDPKMRSASSNSFSRIPTMCICTALPRSSCSRGRAAISAMAVSGSRTRRRRPEWDTARIQAVMNGDQTARVNLKQPIPVLIIYSTGVVEPDGEVQFFQDIYDDDASLKKALAAGYPFPVESLNPSAARVEDGD